MMDKSKTSCDNESEDSSNVTAFGSQSSFMTANTTTNTTSSRSSFSLPFLPSEYQISTDSKESGGPVRFSLGGEILPSNAVQQPTSSKTFQRNSNSKLLRNRSQKVFSQNLTNKQTTKIPHSTSDQLLSSKTEGEIVVEPLRKRKLPRMDMPHKFGIGSGHDLNFHDLLSMPHRAAEQMEELARRVWNAGWNVCHHRSLPDWLKDNDFLIRGHRPELNSFVDCFKSVFRIHTETGNIWTHLIGCVIFLGITVYFLTRPTLEVPLQEKAVFSAFFIGAILCLGFSWVFHTVCCHSKRVGKFFNKLDYCGISVMIMGSFVPWLYYAFYCRFMIKIIYLSFIFILGNASIVVCLWDKFSEPKFRSFRAGMFIGLGLSGIVPAVHFAIADGWYKAFFECSLGWLILMAALYIVGALIYAARIPERLFPGKFDTWGQSHQIFHMFVLAAALVHYHGITEIANYRLTAGNCLVALPGVNSQVY